MYLDQFEDSLVIIRALERDLYIIGEALIAVDNAKFPMSISNLKEIKAFRNIASHAYSRIDPQLIWEMATIDLPFSKKKFNRRSNGSIRKT